mgnify:CR=1 FL=1
MMVEFQYLDSKSEIIAMGTHFNAILNFKY